jgi:hypothetical protein
VVNHSLTSSDQYLGAFQADFRHSLAAGLLFGPCGPSFSTETNPQSFQGAHGQCSVDDGSLDMNRYPMENYPLGWSPLPPFDIPTVGSGCLCRSYYGYGGQIAGGFWYPNPEYNCRCSRGSSGRPTPLQMVGLYVLALLRKAGRLVTPCRYHSHITNCIFL